MSDMYSVKHISQAISRVPEVVYAYAADPRNLPAWAAGLSGAKIEREGDHWISDSPLGQIQIQFAPKNEWGVMDHDVVVPSGEVTHNAFRVIPNGSGSEVVFTLFQGSGVTEAQFKQDADLIQKDLETLKRNLEVL